MKNIVLITLDSVRADHCSFLDYSRNTTPFLNKITKNNGFVFKNAISPGTYTAESMMCTFTGEFSHIVPDAPGMKMSPKPWREEMRNRVTLAEKLSEKGYNTAAFTPNPLTSKPYGYDKGFDLFEDFIENEISSNIYQSLLDKFTGGAGFFISWEKYYDNIMDFVNDSKKPFFLWVFLLDTHEPYNCSKSYRKWSSVLDYLLTYGSKFLGMKENLKKQLIKLYDDSIRYADKFIEKIWKDLSEYDPLFIIHSDHGESFGEHGFYGHGGDYFYEENINIPFVILGTEQDMTISSPFSLKNLYQLLDNKKFLEGNLTRNLFDNYWAISKTFDNNNVRAAVRTERHKLALRDNYELYDLKEDPLEKKNEIGNYSKLENELKKILLKEIEKEKEIMGLKNKLKNIDQIHL